MRLPHNPLWRWLLGTLIGVPACLALWWWYLREPLLAGLVWTVDTAAPLIWPETVLAVKVKGGQAWIISLVPKLSDPPSLFTFFSLPLVRAVAVFPLFWGLTLATPGRGLTRRLLLGTIYLLPVAFVMALFIIQSALTLKSPCLFGLVHPVSSHALYLWAVVGKLSIQVLPMVAPLLVWLGLHGDFIRTILAARLTRRAVRSIEPPFAIKEDSSQEDSDPENFNREREDFSVENAKTEEISP